MTTAPPDDFPADCLASVRMAVQHVADALYAAERVHRQVRHRDDVRAALGRASAILAAAEVMVTNMGSPRRRKTA